MSSFFDPENFRLAKQEDACRKPTTSPRSAGRIRGRFLKGPVPLNWLVAASRLPGKAMHVAIILRYLSGLKKSLDIRFSQAVARDFGIKRQSAYRALFFLVESGLIRVRRQRGRNSVVRIVDLDSSAIQECRDTPI